MSSKSIIKKEGNDNANRGRGRGGRGRGGRRPYYPSASYQPKFKGKTENLAGFIYDVGVGNQADLFMKTTIELAEYAERNCKDSLDIRSAIESLTEVSIAIPQERNTGNTKIDEMLFSKDFDNFIKRETSYRQNKAMMYSIVIGQCSKAMKAKLEGDSSFE